MPSSPALSGVASVCSDINVGPLDPCKYRAFTLLNGLRAFIVSDTSTDKAAGALDVSVGSFSDPPNIPGLAHFLEHMLFLGTAKYPHEDSFNTFLAENAGHSNAFTAPENTNFHFSMLVSDRQPESPSPRLYEALDRFAQFFTAPLFTESATDRELNAVDSEHHSNLQNDGLRIHQLKCSVANPQHPYSKFSTGNKDTLCHIPQREGIDIRSQLLAFHKDYYSAHLMNLCIFAPYPLDVLQRWVVELFSAIPNHHCPHPAESYRHIQPLLANHRGVVIYTDLVRDNQLLEVSWITKSYKKEYDSKPKELVSSLFGHEGEGSLLSLLKKRGWADRLLAHGSDSNTFGNFQLTISLTNSGLESVDQVIATLFQYARMLKQSGVPKWFFDEEAKISDISFRFRDPEDPMAFVTEIAAFPMSSCPPRDYISSQFLYKSYNVELIHEMLDCITPENCTVVIAGKSVVGEHSLKEKWYDSTYRIEKIGCERLDLWTKSESNPSLHLPNENPFIPSEFGLLEDPLDEDVRDMEGPKMIERNKYFELHHKLDRTFKRPIGEIILSFYSPDVYRSPWHTVMAQLFMNLLQDSLAEYLYSARCVGFEYSMSKEVSGIKLLVDGYSHRLDVVLDAIVRKLRDFKADPVDFEMQKDILERRYRNFGKLESSALVQYNSEILLKEPRWHVDEYCEAIESGSVTLEALDAFKRDYVGRMWVTGLVCGNISAEKAVSMMEKLKESIGYSWLSASEKAQQRIVQVPLGRDVLYRMAHTNDDDNNSAIYVCYQMGPMGDVYRDSKLQLLSDILQKPAFHELRTIQQLGYVVFLGLDRSGSIDELFLLIQSSIADPDVLLERIEKFLVDVRENLLESMTEEKFDDYIKGLVAVLSEPDRTLSNQASRFWGEIDGGNLEFDRRERKIEALKHIGKEGVVKLFDECLAAGGKQVRRIVSQVYGKPHPFSDRKDVGNEVWEVTDPVEFRRKNMLYPLQGFR